jgi:hypothetical protein
MSRLGSVNTRILAIASVLVLALLSATPSGVAPCHPISKRCGEAADAAGINISSSQAALDAQAESEKTVTVAGVTIKAATAFKEATVIGDSDYSAAPSEWGSIAFFLENSPGSPSSGIIEIQFEVGTASSHLQWLGQTMVTISFNRATNEPPAVAFPFRLDAHADPGLEFIHFHIRTADQTLTEDLSFMVLSATPGTSTSILDVQTVAAFAVGALTGALIVGFMLSRRRPA